MNLSWPRSGAARGASRRSAAKPRAGRPGSTRSRRPRHAPGSPRVPFAILVTALLVGGMGLLLLLNTASAANEVRRHDLASQDAGIAAQVQELRNEVAASAAPSNLAEAAAALGMVPAANPAFLVIGAGGAVTLLGSPAAATGAPVVPPAHHTKPKTATHSSTSASKSASESASKSASKSSSKKPSSSSSATPTPTPTPTPTVTLPGGPR